MGKLKKTNTAPLCEREMENGREEEIALDFPALEAERANTFLYPSGHARERWVLQEEVKEVELYPLCPTEQIDLALQALPLGPSLLEAVSLFIPLIEVVLCLPGEDTAALLHSPAPQSWVTLALLLPTLSHIRSHTHNLFLMQAGL